MCHGSSSKTAKWERRWMSLEQHQGSTHHQLTMFAEVISGNIPIQVSALLLLSRYFVLLSLLCSSFSQSHCSFFTLSLPVCPPPSFFVSSFPPGIYALTNGHLLYFRTHTQWRLPPSLLQEENLPFRKKKKKRAADSMDSNK